jgi:hypothetical protein
METRGKKRRWEAETSMDDVEDDLRKMKIKKWWSTARNRVVRKILREAEAHSEL